MPRHREAFTSRVRSVAAAAAAVSLADALAVCLSAQAAEKWDAAIQKFEDQDKVSPPPQNGVVFIGASSLQIALCAFEGGARELWSHDARFVTVPGLRLVRALS
jgi:hypothetical protein